MKKIKLIYLKNQMLVANSIANFIGVLVVNTLMLSIQETFAIEILESPIAFQQLTEKGLQGYG